MALIYNHIGLPVVVVADVETTLGTTESLVTRTDPPSRTVSVSNASLQTSSASSTSVTVPTVTVSASASTSLSVTGVDVSRTPPPQRTVNVSNASLQTSSASSTSVTVPTVTVSATASRSLSATPVDVTRNPPPSRTVNVSNASLQTSAASSTSVTIPNDPPFASLTATTTSNAREAKFDASGSSDPNADQLVYRFDPGDGSGFGPFTTSDVVTHTYSSPGTFTVTVEVRDGRGGSDTANDTVTIFGTSPL